MKRFVALLAGFLLMPHHFTIAQQVLTVGQSGGYDYSTIQAAIDAATEGDTVMVYPGLYVENIRFAWKNIVLRSIDPTDTAIVATTIIDGDRKESVVRVSGPVTSECVISGFTIRNGRGRAGGGICGPDHYPHSFNTYPRIENNLIIGNGAGYTGGGIIGCSGLILNNTICSNSAGSSGGGLAQCNGVIRHNIIAENISSGRFSSGGGGLSECYGIIEHNTITSNSAVWGSGLYSCKATIRHNTITGNSAGSGGGGALASCSGLIHNNIIYGNLASYAAGLYGCSGTISNNTIAGNFASGEGVGLNTCETADIVNCIVWGNKARLGVEPQSQLADCSVPGYSCIQGWTGGGVGNISADPLFSSGPLGSYYLSQTAAGQALQSPCVDAGTSAVAELGFRFRTTRTDDGPDANLADMGYHYPFSGAPLLPTDLTAVAVLETRIDLSWQDNASNEDGFKIERRLATSATWSVIAATGADETTYRDIGLTPQTTYCYRVRAYNAMGHSDYSNVASVTTPRLEPANLVVFGADFAPAAPHQMQPGDWFGIITIIQQTGERHTGPFWIEVLGSRTGGLTLDRILGNSIWLGSGLAGGEQYLWLATMPLTSVPDGPYTLVLTVDRPGQVPEGNERDNRWAVAKKRLLVIRPITDVDLAVEDFAMTPNPARSGQQVALSGRVVNRGTAPSGPFWIEFWGSRSWPYPSLDFFLCDSIYVGGGLPPGEAIALSDFLRTLYDVPDGLFMAGCVVNRDDSVNEKDIAKNYHFVDAQTFNRESALVRPRPEANGLADIVVTAGDFSPYAPTQSAPNDAATFTLTVENQGTTDTGRFWIEYWGSSDYGLTLHYFLAKSDLIENLAPGEALSLVQAKPLYSVPDGPYSVVIVADRPGNVAETNEANNRFVVAGKRLLVIRPQTDANLVLENFAFAAADTSPAIQLGGTVRNTGTNDSGAFWIEFWACPGDPDYPWLHTFCCDSILVENLAPGEAFDLSTQHRQFYSGLTPGIYAIIGFVDRLDQVNETDETDNYTVLRGFSPSIE